MRLKGKVSVVTGGGSGFGKAIATLFAKEGSNIIVNDINDEAGQNTVELINNSGGKASYVNGDVSTEKCWNEIKDAALNEFGKVSVVVNNAGFTHKNQSMFTVDEDTFDKMYAINVKSLFWSSKVLVPTIDSNGGSFITIASVSGLRPRPGLVWYAGSKAAAILTSKAMAVELAPKKIRVNCVNPVISPTGLIEKFMGMENTAENREKFLGTIPLGRMAKPDDVANAALYFASDEAEFITGAAIEVDGGRAV